MAMAAEAPTNPVSRSASLPTISHRSSGAAAAHPREQFLAGLLNEDLQTITKWHGSRPHHEQKRFLRSVNTLYKAFEAADNGTMAEKARKLEADRKKEDARAAAVAAEARAAALARAVDEDPLSAPPRLTPRGGGGPGGSVGSLGSLGSGGGSRGGGSTSAALGRTMPELKPIDVFAETKRMQLRRKQNPDEDPNTLLNWMDGQSMTSGSTAQTASTQMTRFSQLTVTSSGGSSLCSDPGTTNQLHFRHHKRGFALNQNRWKASNPHEAGNLKDGIPSIGFPETERMMTQFKDAFGDVRLQGANISKEMYQSVLKSNSHPFVKQFLDSADPKQKEQFADMLRCLEYLRKSGTSRNMSLQKEEMNLAENRRLFNPSRQRPMFDTSEINISKVPLGNLPTGKKTVAPSPPQDLPDPHPAPPASPAVSGLGSVPLSRLSTPAVL